MELDDIRKILKLLKGTDITELSFEKDGARIRIKRGKGSVVREVKEEMEPSSPMLLSRKADVPVAEPEAQGLFTVTSPIVGTFYRSPSPDAPPFADVGTEVKKGQVLCIIEAMKLMNEIESEVEGTIVRVLVDNGQPVEYGEPLFLVNPR